MPREPRAIGRTKQPSKIANFCAIGTRPIRLRWHLVGLVFAVTVPLLVFSAILIFEEIRKQHEAVERGLRDTARALSSASDREIATARLVLEALAESQYLEAGDFRAFHQLSSAAAAKFDGARIILFALDGQQLTNTMRTYGTPLPNPLRDAESAGRDSNYPDLPVGGFAPLREVIRTERPVVSDMFIALSNRRPSVAIDIPVMRGGKLVYVLDIAFGPKVLDKLLSEQQIPSGWFAAVFDSRGIVIARSINAEKFIGKPSSIDLTKRLAQSNEWSGAGRVLEGTPVYTAIVRSKATGWITAVAVSQTVADEAINRSFMALISGGALLLFVSLAGAFLISRKLANPIVALAESAEKIQGGEPLAIDPGILEVNALHDALTTAGAAARAGAQEREQRLVAEAREAELKEADRRKDEFLATLSHELRNPIAPIRNAIEIMKSLGPLEPKLEWCRDLIDQQIGLMARLMDDLLDLGRITRDRLVLRKEEIELHDMINRAVEISRPQIEGAHHKLTVDLPPQGLILSGDPARLTQVFANLLNNAAKYTDDQGEIKVTATLSSAPQSNQVIVSVKDNGIGIAPDSLPHLYDMFFQAESGRDRSDSGLGIGLTLARRLIEMHGGMIEAKSAGLGQGSEFVVYLPLLRVDSIGDNS